MEILVFAVLLGLIPAFIAKSKGRNFFGWWVYGALIFIVALVHSLVMKPDQHKLDRQQIASGDMKKCPHCAELVKSDARVCRYCSRELVYTPSAA